MNEVLELQKMEDSESLEMEKKSVSITVFLSTISNRC